MEKDKLEGPLSNEEASNDSPCKRASLNSFQMNFTRKRHKYTTTFGDKKEREKRRCQRDEEEGKRVQMVLC